jgi:hypothetical protein
MGLCDDIDVEMSFWCHRHYQLAREFGQRYHS